jgi:hypothetical protein
MGPYEGPTRNDPVTRWYFQARKSFPQTTPPSVRIIILDFPNMTDELVPIMSLPVISRQTCF